MITIAKWYRQKTLPLVKLCDVYSVDTESPRFKVSKQNLNKRKIRHGGLKLKISFAYIKTLLTLKWRNIITCLNVHKFWDIKTNPGLKLYWFFIS